MIKVNNVNTESFRKNKYYKVVNSYMGFECIHHYKLGLNIYKYSEIESINLADGMYFTNIENIFNYINYGSIVLEITIPEDAIVIENPESFDTDSPLIPGWCSDKLIVDKIIYLSDPDSVMELISKGAKTSCHDYALFKWAFYNNAGVFCKLGKLYGKYNIIKAAKLDEDYLVKI